MDYNCRSCHKPVLYTHHWVSSSSTSLTTDSWQEVCLSLLCDTRTTPRNTKYMMWTFHPTLINIPAMSLLLVSTWQQGSLPAQLDASHQTQQIYQQLDTTDNTHSQNSMSTKAKKPLKCEEKDFTYCIQIYKLLVTLRQAKSCKLHTFLLPHCWLLAHPSTVTL